MLANEPLVITGNMLLPGDVLTASAGLFHLIPIITLQGGIILPISRRDKIQP